MDRYSARTAFWKSESRNYGNSNMPWMHQYCHFASFQPWFSILWQLWIYLLHNMKGENFQYFCMHL